MILRLLPGISRLRMFAQEPSFLCLPILPTIPHSETEPPRPRETFVESRTLLAQVFRHPVISAPWPTRTVQEGSWNKRKDSEPRMSPRICKGFNSNLVATEKSEAYKMLTSASIHLLSGGNRQMICCCWVGPFQIHLHAKVPAPWWNISWRGDPSPQQGNCEPQVAAVRTKTVDPCDLGRDCEAHVAGTVCFSLMPQVFASVDRDR